MAYTSSEARQQLLDAVANAIDELGFALACLGEAFERLDEVNAERLEDGLFRAAQQAYGRAKRTHTEFASRHGLGTATFEQATVGVASGVPELLERTVDAVSRADAALAGAQDSELLIEVGDEQLRAGIAAARTALGGFPEQARSFTRTLGR